jgi:hypothetical protein
VQILDRAKLWKEGMMEQIKREISIMKDLRERQAIPWGPVPRLLTWKACLSAACLGFHLCERGTR